MTQIENVKSSVDVSREARADRRSAAVPAAVGGSLVVWALARVSQAALVVGSGADARTVGWVDVLVTSSVASALGLVVLVWLSRRLRAGRRVFVLLATLALLVSLAGPAGASTAGAFAWLAAMHLVVWSALVIAARSSRGTL